MNRPGSCSVSRVQVWVLACPLLPRNLGSLASSRSRCALQKPCCPSQHQTRFLAGRGGRAGAAPRLPLRSPQRFTSPSGLLSCSHGDVHLDCLGSIQDKITVCATDDSYQKARQSLAQAEEETRSRGAIVIKPGGRYLGKAWGVGLHPWGSCACWADVRRAGESQGPSGAGTGVVG